MLLYAGVPPDMPIGPLRRTALHLSVLKNDELMCQLLLNFGADMMAIDGTPPTLERKSGGLTPIEIAQDRDYLPIMQLFSMAKKPDADMDLGPNAPPRRP